MTPILSSSSQICSRRPSASRSNCRTASSRAIAVLKEYSTSPGVPSTLPYLCVSRATRSFNASPETCDAMCATSSCSIGQTTGPILFRNDNWSTMWSAIPS